ncbi:unnamed protein product [Fusarium langsethiae]|nr:unnamed protein product [Fusarium langsethiae]
MALTPKGRQLYDDLINEWRETVGSFTGAESKEKHLAKIFAKFPDDMETLRKDKLAYFSHKPVHNAPKVRDTEIDALVSSGAVVVEPITYEDFLPVSAAGIFHSNLGDDGGMSHTVGADKNSFEKSLGCRVKKEFELYSDMQEASIRECFVTSC